jgi:hypothetical protein
MSWLRVCILFIGGLVLTVTAWSSEEDSCLRNLYGKVVCPPPGGVCMMNAVGDIACSPPSGGIVITLDGHILCGPGTCVIGPDNEAFCSTEPGGSVSYDSYGEPVCTGGCVPASDSACSRP